MMATSEGITNVFKIDPLRTMTVYIKYLCLDQRWLATDIAMPKSKVAFSQQSSPRDDIHAEEEQLR